jgi:RecA-family ATPase
MTQLPVQPVGRLADCPEQLRWLVDGLWSEGAVGIIGSEPKCCKSFLALDLTVGVAAGIPCLRRFVVSRCGWILPYPAEDDLHIVRRRLEGICIAADNALAQLDVHVITAPSLLLDLDADRTRLNETVARLKPCLLDLDPFVRPRRIDENVSGDVVPLLAFLRELQHCHAVTVAVVHHARKGASTIRAGQALPGSAEFHVWGDSNLCLRRDSDDRIVLTVEHRAAATPNVTLELAQRNNAVTLQPVQADPQPESRVEPLSVDQRKTAAFSDGGKRRPFAELRASCRIRSTTLYERLVAMIAAGLIVKSTDGYCLAVPGSLPQTFST